MAVYELEGKVPEIGKDAYIHETASVIGEVTIGEASWIGPGASIRGDYGLFLRRNVVHAADSTKTAKRETEIFFKPGEILDYKKADEEWVYES